MDEAQVTASSATVVRKAAVRRWRWVTGILACSLALTACEAPRPDVTFYGNRTAVETGPTRWCEVDLTAQSVACTEAAEQDIPTLALRPGQSVQINVPGAVGTTPWAVYFRYRNADGALADGRTEIFTDGRLAYTLRPFTDLDQLVYVEVQSGFILMGGAESGVDFAATHSWLLLINPEEPPVTTAAG